MFLRTLHVLIAAVVLLPQATQGQTPADKGLVDLLKKNEPLIVIGKDGRKTIGRLAEVAADSIAISGSAGRVRSFAKADILEVRKPVPDGLGNGAAAGAAIGFGSVLLICKATAEDDFLFDSTTICLASSLIFGAPGGLIAGLVADKLHTKTVTVYPSPAESKPRVRVAALLTPSRVGLRASVRLGR